jgi:chaperonin GroES
MTTSSFSLRPLLDRIAIARLESETKTPAGLIIPDTAKEKPITGKVLAIGPGALNDQGQPIPMQVKVGDHVLFGKWSGTETKIDGQDIVIMKESDVLGILNTPKNA